MRAEISVSTRGEFIIRRGILRCGIPLAIIVFAWTMFSHATGRPDLSSASWWRAIIGVFVIAILEWGVGAGWLIGAVWWELTRGEERKSR